MGDRVWLIAVQPDTSRECYLLSEQDVEGVVNAMRHRGFRRFFVTRLDYEINDSGRVKKEDE